MSDSGALLDLHTHCMPGMDDGAKDAETSRQMLRLLRSQGVTSAALTPHFYPHRENLQDFRRRRDESAQRMDAFAEDPHLPVLLPGAEIYLTQELCKLDLRPLCIGQTNLLLLELPRVTYKPWISEEIRNIAYTWDVTPVLAHIERYRLWYGPAEFNALFSFDEMILQFNAAALLDRADLKFLTRLAQRGYPFAIGSDCHDLSARSPCFDAALPTLRGKKGRGILSHLLSQQELTGAAPA